MIKPLGFAAILLALGTMPALAEPLFCIASPDTGQLQNMTLADAEPYFATQNGEGRAWVVSRDPITVGDKSFSPYGLPRAVKPEELTYFGNIEGVPVLYAAGTAPDNLLFVILNSNNCMVQPYALDVQ